MKTRAAPHHSGRSARGFQPPDSDTGMNHGAPYRMWSNGLPSHDTETENNIRIKMGNSHGSNTKQKVKSVRKRSLKHKDGKDRHYITHWNGGDAFDVNLSDNTAIINPLFTDGKKKRYKFQTAFIGVSPRIDGQDTLNYGKHLIGNSILLQISERKYILISGEDIREFLTKEPILEFYSPVWTTSSIPYPAAVTDNYIYDLYHFKLLSRGDKSLSEVEDIVFDANDHSLDDLGKTFEFKLL